MTLCVYVYRYLLFYHKKVLDYEWSRRSRIISNRDFAFDILAILFLLLNCKYCLPTCLQWTYAHAFVFRSLYFHLYSLITRQCPCIFACDDLSLEIWHRIAITCNIFSPAAACHLCHLQFVTTHSLCQMLLMTLNWKVTLCVSSGSLLHKYNTHLQQLESNVSLTCVKCHFCQLVICAFYYLSIISNATCLTLSLIGRYSLQASFISCPYYIMSFSFFVLFFWNEFCSEWCFGRRCEVLFVSL